jgi:predicted ribosome quality control (RQC) complex YloA/Tae2 family protein
MFNNYFILNKLVTELNRELQGYKITRAFSFEKEKMTFILSNGSDESTLEISVNPGFPFLILKRKISIPKKNLVDFFNARLPLNIISVEIADNDRIIRIQTDNSSLYFAIRGKFTNMYLIHGDSEIESFKKSDEKIKENFRQEVLKCRFISGFNNLKIEDESIDLYSIRKKYPVIGKDIINETNLRLENAGNLSKDILNGIIREIKENKSALFIDEDTGDVNLGIESFNVFPFTRKKIFDRLIDTYNNFLIQKFSRESIFDKKKIIEKHLERELNKISGKLNDVRAHLLRTSREEEYKKKADILLININKLSKGREKIELPDLYDENVSVTIKLDPKLSSKQNVDLYFEKARNEKIKIEKMKALFSELNIKFSELSKIKAEYLNAESAVNIDSIMKELKIKQEVQKKSEEDIKSKFRHYIIDGKYNVYVGKDSKSNDLLTMKFARQNDYWFHARSVSGSHVVLKNEYPKEGIPKNILKSAASIAAYHSKAKTSGMVPVSYTQKKYVTKKKGMDPGKVALLREDVLIVKPEIPAGGKYDSET